MANIFLPNCRVKQTANGILFYEQDVLCCEYVFAGDLKIDLTADILEPGFGIVLLKNNDKPALEANKVHIFKLGSLDFSVIKKKYSIYSIPSHSSCSFVPPSNNVNIRFIKSGAKISMYIGDLKISDYVMTDQYDSYRIGFYSNKNNTIKSARIYGGTPEKWTTNVKNTNGGRVKFFLNGFTIENCEHNLEVEQDKVELKAGTYYLDCAKSEGSDIESFVFEYNDQEVDDTDKTILNNKDGKFIMKDDGYVDIKFKGHDGTVKNVCIKDDPESSYVQTDKAAVTIDGSWIKINLAGLKRVIWSGIIYTIPDESDLTKPSKYSIVETKKQSLRLGDLGVEKKQSYDYEVTTDKMQLTVAGRVKDLELTQEDGNVITVFNNVNAKITKLILTMEDGTEINVIVQKTYKFYLPASVKGPIIVIDENEVPLDLSSSYRYAENDKEYVFTNWEREIFTSDSEMVLASIPGASDDSVIIYGVADAGILDKDRIFNIPNKESINSVDLCADKYSIISGKEYDREDANIEIDSSIRSKYKYFIVDYLKQDSYCVNFIESLNNNEIDISTDCETLYIVHEKDTSSGYITTEIYPTGNKYIVLRKAAG